MTLQQRLGSFAVEVVIMRPLARKFEIEPLLVLGLHELIFRYGNPPDLEEISPELTKFADIHGLSHARVASLMKGIFDLPEPDAAGWRRIMRQAQVRRNRTSKGV
jgi:hypothetical protein